MQRLDSSLIIQYEKSIPLFSHLVTPHAPWRSDRSRYPQTEYPPLPPSGLRFYLFSSRPSFVMRNVPECVTQLIFFKYDLSLF